MEFYNYSDQVLEIRPIMIEDYEFVLAWSKDDQFCLANDWGINREEEELHGWWLHCVNSVNKNFIRKGIEWNKKLIGYVDLVLINDETAELGIAIGDRTLWGQGIGVQACISMMEYAIENLAISEFYAETHAANIRSRKMLEKIGFKEISRKGIESYLGEDSQLIQYRIFC